MHRFDTLINSGAAFTLGALEKANAKIIEELQTSATTAEVQSLQMIQLQKVVMAIGMFSLFESILQQRLSCENGFTMAKEHLKSAEKFELLERFNKFHLAVNVLKHGKGKSYNTLISQADRLPFQIKQENQCFFDEGVIDEVSTYIKVDNDFVMNCANIIQQVSNAISDSNETYFL